jgi:cysteinyl-tRNA synthetase
MFTDEALDSAERSLVRLRGALRPATGSASTGEDADLLRQATETARVNFVTAMDDDFNTSSALAALFDLVRAINSARDAGVSGPFFEAAQRTLQELAVVLGITLTDAADSGQSVAAKPFIDLLVTVRSDLRTAKQWALSDQIRDGLKELGVTIEDSRDGSTWRFEEQ